MKRIKKFCKNHAESIATMVIVGAASAYSTYKFMDKKTYVGFEPSFDDDNRMNAVILSRKDGLFDVLTKRIESDITFE